MRKGLIFTEIDLTGKPEERMKLAVKASGATTVPQVFIGGEYVGDCDELQVLEARGRLNTLVAVQ